MLTIQEFIHASRVTGQYLPTQISRFTALEIREQIQILMAEGQMELAQALGDAGLACYPDSVDMLTINSLMAVMRRDWQTSVDLLMEMMEGQGDKLQPAVYVSLLNTLKNFITSSQMLALVHVGLEHFPTQAALLAEKTALDTQALLTQDPSRVH
jgi:hypothetical protein